MNNSVMYQLLLVAILYRMALGATTTTPANIEPYDDVPVPVVFNDGGTGEVETNVTNQLTNLERKKEKQFTDHNAEILDQQNQDEYNNWLDDCAASDEAPPDIPEEVAQFLNSINMTEAELREKCEKMKSGQSKRGKRLLHKGAGVWDKCIIPYKFDSSYSKENQIEALRVHKYLRLETGFRFYEFNNTNREMGLGHDNYLIYYTGNTCSSNVGNLRGKKQWIAACGSFSVILHELGHAMGLQHESNDPAGLISGMMHINFNNLVEKYWHTRHPQEVHNDKLFYELTSYMSAGNYGTLRGYGPWISIDEPELTKLIAHGDYFYSMMEVQKFHKCYDEFSSCSTLPECDFGGYPSIVKSECACACPEGLDPATKCSTLRDVLYSGSWPAGTFTFLKAKGTSCPQGFSDGQMARWNYGKIWEKGESSLSEGKKDDYEFVFDVCTQTTSTDGGDWPAGEYCILKKGDCPKGFEQGRLETWGKIPERENSSNGALPDGKKGQNFEFMFCCRSDGHYSIPIKLPSREPFVMYTKYNTDCQKVDGMHVSKEIYVTTTDTSKTLAFEGSLPYYWNYNDKTYYVYYCVYSPLNLDGKCGGVKKFSAGEKTYTFTSPNYPNKYSKESECLWYFQSPKGTTMKIEFSDFEVSTAEDESCKSYVELRTVISGMTGYRLCGHYEKKTRLTMYNSLTVKLATSTNEQQKGFKATITVLSESEQCYPKDGHKTYSGTMSYTRSFRPCVSWSKVRHCILHQFSHSTMVQDLNNNYCRNTMGRMPWCYVNAELCERENCDVCMRDRCYDVLPNCDSIIKGDAHFCTKNDLGEAKRGCMKSCGFCDQFKQIASYTTVTCPAPGAVTEITPTPVKSSYNVGEQVSYSCPSSHVVRRRTCQSDGTWSPLGYVCSGCSDGWTYVRGRCYQYQQFKRVKYSEAKKICEDLQSTIAVVDSDEQATEVMELTFGDIANNGYIYIGIEYIDGAWTPIDGSKPEYISWYPNYTNNKNYCVIGKGYKTLYAAWCGYKREVMCSRRTTEPFVCEDDFTNCLDILADNPGMCEEYPDYAWTNCRKTCGVAGCTETSSCTVSTVDNAKQVRGSNTNAKQGQYVEYKCNDGFLLKSGNLNRTCLSTGSFNGNPPICASPADVDSITLFSEVELFRRETFLRSYFNYLEVANLETTRITVSGKITAWEFFASEAGEVTFFVWRPNANSKLEFTLVGKNTLTVTADNRAVTMAVSADDQIAAKAGDVIGLVLPSKPVITFSECNKKNVPQFAPWLTTPSRYYAADMTVGKAFTFKEYDKSCRVYSIRVVMNPTA